MDLNAIMLISCAKQVPGRHLDQTPSTGKVSYNRTLLGQEPFTPERLFTLPSKGLSLNANRYQRTQNRTSRQKLGEKSCWATLDVDATWMQMRRDQQTRHNVLSTLKIKNKDKNNPESLKFEHPVFLRLFSAS